MDQGPFAEQIIGTFNDMTAQIRLAARYVLDNPRDVALLSMREQARQAGVQPATMTRLAKHLGVDGYEVLRERYAEAIRGGDLGFADRASAQVQSQLLNGDKALAADMLSTIGRHLAVMASPVRLQVLEDAAATLAGARRIFCLGLRSSFGAAWHFNYILSLMGEQCILLDGNGETGIDPVRNAGPSDALVVFSVRPYTRATLEVARHVADQGARIVAVTDSNVAPLAQNAAHTILVSTESPSFFHTMAPVYTIAEMLAVLVAGHGGSAALEALRHADSHLSEFGVYLSPRVRPELP